MGTAWTTLDLPRRMFVIVAAVGMFAAVLMMARSAGNPEMSLLFGGVDPRAAGEIITVLDQQGVVYDVRGSAIYVPSSERDALRLTLAGNGLPGAGAQGYELLDQMSGFSTTSQMFDAAYWRAKEGELARTILANPHIRAARVHISTPSNRPFQRSQMQTAAVTITTAGGTLSPRHVEALQSLVGGAVPQLNPEDVAIIDDNGGLLSDGSVGTLGSDTTNRADVLRQRAERLLAARVGPGNAVVEVAMETVTETEQVTERLVDPDSRIAISTDVTESTGTSTDSRGSAVTVASNLPDGDVNGADGGSSDETSESRTLTNYEVSQTERQLVKAAGAVKRLTVAVLINDAIQILDDGTTVAAPRPDEELEALRELVASAVGIDPDRGDILTLKSMSFEPTTPLGTEVLQTERRLELDFMQLIQIGVLAVVALILGLFVVRPILAPGQRGSVPLEIGNDAPQIEIDPPMAMAMGDGGMGDFMGGDFGGAIAGSDDPVSRMRQMISDRQPETLQVLQDWIEEPAAKRGVI